MADIFREVDEELRREGLAKLWKRYGSLVTGAAVLVVVATAGYVGWQHYAESQRLRRGEAYSQAVALSGQANATQADAALADLARKEDGYGVLARFRQAGLKVDAGDKEGAVAIYDAIAADAAVDGPFRDAALILAALNSLDTADPASLIARLEPLTAAANPWHYSALEMTGLLARRAGQTARAREIFTALADDPHAPAALQRRAGELLGLVQG